MVDHKRIKVFDENDWDKFFLCGGGMKIRIINLVLDLVVNPVNFSQIFPVPKHDARTPSLNETTL